jgi:beta-exotoxin I transport system permease protein
MSLFVHALRRLRTQILIFGIGLAIWGSMYVFMFPLVRDSMSNIEYPPEILAAFGAGGTDLGDPRLFFDVEFFSLAPSIAAVFVVIAGTAALAGEESGGTMDFLAALPLSRRRLFWQKALAIAAGAALITAIIALGWILTGPFAEYRDELPIRDIAGATFLQLPFMLFIGSAALLLGAVAPSRSAAAAWSGGLLVVAYLAVTIASVTDRLEWLRYLSPYYYTDLPGILEDGPNAWHQFVLLVLIVLTGAAGLRAWEGREIGAGNWQWRALIAGGTSELDTRKAPSGSVPARPPGRRPPLKRWTGIAIALVVLVGIGLGIGAAAFSSGKLSIGQRGPLNLSGRIDASGARIYPPATGVVRLVLVQQGDEVHQGQVLGWLSNAVDGSDQPILAPLDGSLTDLTLEKGQSLVAGTPVGEVHETGRLRAVFEVNESDLKSIHVGQPVELSISSIGVNLTSEVGSLSGIPISEVGQARTKPKYEVWCPLPESDSRIAIGMRVKGKFQR